MSYNIQQRGLQILYQSLLILREKMQFRLHGWTVDSRSSPLSYFSGFYLVSDERPPHETRVSLLSQQEFSPKRVKSSGITEKINRKLITAGKSQRTVLALTLSGQTRDHILDHVMFSPFEASRLFTSSNVVNFDVLVLCHHALRHN